MMMKIFKKIRKHNSNVYFLDFFSLLTADVLLEKVKRQKKRKWHFHE